ncbi:MAG TPA: hypothetical protein VE291_00155 [Terracidiphilus sp.]|jgi:hypothetical protein|nr:hypothetical protein [Terracidiphilus sp.]
MPLDFSTGIRRLALGCGLVGGLAGVYGSYQALDQLFFYRKFKSLANSEVVRREGQNFINDVQSQRSSYLEEENELKDKTPPLDTSANVPQERINLSIQIEVLTTRTYDSLRRIQNKHSDLNRSGIKAVHWTENYAFDSISDTVPWPRHLDVESIELLDGDVLYPTPSPSARQYLMILFSPLLGFLIPWLIVRLVAWIATGFFRTSSA